MAKNPWEVVHTYANGLSYHAGVVYNKRAASIGGIGGNPPAEVPWIFGTQNGINLDPTIQTPIGLTARAEHAACVFDERVFVSGGVDGQTQFNDVLVSEDMRKWETLFHAPDGFYNHRMVAFGNPRVKLVILGGYTNTGGGVHLDMIQQSSDGRNWDVVTPQGAMWAGREGFGAVVYKNKLWVFGGMRVIGGTEVVYNDVWWTDDLIHWHLALEHAPWLARENFGYCEWDERVWIIGGNGYAGRTKTPIASANSVWFSRDMITWEQSFDFPSALRNTFVAPIDNRMHVFGGVGHETSITKLNLG